MSSTTNILITPSTSLILIRNVSTPTNIYLSSYNTANFTVSVRDVTGSSTIQTNPIYLSTIGKSRFMDGSFLYTVNQPYGFVNLGFRNSSFWQVLHTSGQAPDESAATVGKLNISTSYTDFLSTTTANISSFLVENLTTTNAITITGPLVLTNLSAPGIVTIQSTFNVYGDVQIDNQLFVSGNSLFHSSLTVTELLPISSVTRVFSSFGIGSTLSVGGTLTIGSTLFTQSDNFVSSLQVQKSTTGVTTTVEGILNVGGLLSSLRSFAVETIASVNKPGDFVFVRQSLSSIAENATFSTNTLTVFGETLGKSSFQANTAIVVSTFAIGSTFQVLQNARLSSIAIGDSFYTNILSTNTLSTLSSFSTGIANFNRSTFLSSGLSTTGIEVLTYASISQFFVTAATVSTGLTSFVTVNEEVNVAKNATFDNLFLNSTLVTESVRVSSLTLASGGFFSSLSTLGDLTASGEVLIGYFANTVKGLRVFKDARVNSNLINSGEAIIGAVDTPSYLLDTLNLRTSTPSIALQASTFVCEHISTTDLVINETDPPTRTVNNTFASTTQFDTAIAEAVRVESAYTSSLFWGFSTFSNVDVSLDVLSWFPKGVSAQTIFVNAMNAKIISTIRFVGDAQGVSNVSLGTISTLSVNIAFASTVSTSIVYTSSLYSSTFKNTFFTETASSFQSPTLAVEGIGFPFRNDINQILLINSNLYSINETIFINTLENRVGVNLSTPLADLDISGGLYCEGGLLYSSINFMVVSSPGVTNLSTLFTGNAFIRDQLTLGYPKANFVNPNPTSFGFPTFEYASSFVLDSQTGLTGTGTTFGITALPSSIALMNTLFIENDLKSVRLYPNSPLKPEFTLNTMAVSTIGNFSSVESYVNILTNSLTTPSFLINPPYFPSVTTMSTGSEGLYINEGLLTFVNSLPPKMGIHTKNPTTNLDIHGSAYVSSVDLQGILQTRNLSMGSALL